MKLLNTETPVTRNVMPQIVFNVQDFYVHKVGYTSYDEGIFGPKREFSLYYWLPLQVVSYIAPHVLRPFTDIL
jgi:hypothetical protein